MSLAHSLEIERTNDVMLDDSTIATFESFLLNTKLVKNLLKNGFKKPSPIQLKALPIGRCGFDLIVKAKSGTGKTLVFSIIALETIDLSKNETQVLILAPTREIAVQIQEVVQCIGSYVEGLRVQSFIGGLPVERDKEKCKICHIAVGAPGRVKHLIKDGILKTSSVRLLVLDEADKLMDSSLQDDINEIYNSLPDRKQIITTSATYPKELEEFLSKYMLSPTSVTTETSTPLLLGVKQFVKILEPSTNVVKQMKIKNEQILEIISNISFTQCMVFTNYQTRAESISNILNQKGWNSTYISAAQSQTERLTAINNLKKFNCRILLSTDLTARGIDAANVDLVINYDIPHDSMTYLHRMGRAGRYGSSGVCINFAFSGAELQQLQKILGEIGGSSLSIPILPTYNGALLDLLSMEISPDNYISGVVFTTEISQTNLNIKNKLFELKKVKDQSKTKTKEDMCGRKNKSNNEECSWQTDGSENSSDVQFKKLEGNIMNILNNSTKGASVVSEQFFGIDANGLLESLTSGSTSKAENRNSHINNSATVQHLLYNNDHKKRKRSNGKVNTVSIDDSGFDQQKWDKKTKLYHKNKALLVVTKILSSEKCNIDKLDLDCIQQYLEMSKAQDRSDAERFSKKYRNVDSIDILNNIETYINLQKGDCLDLVANDSLADIESIFKIGYESAVKSNSRHWRSYLPNSEIENFERLCLKEDTKEDSGDENDWEIDEEEYDKEEEFDDEDEYFNGEEYNNYEEREETNETLNDATNIENDPDDNLMKWIPVEKNKNNVCRLETDVTNWENLNTYFTQCSDNLWQNGLSFETVETFDDWFYYEWQAQVAGIRNYIQQNIYVQEMSKYQQMSKK